MPTSCSATRPEMGLASPTVANIRNWGWAGYLQDDWKVNRRLTVNMGLRYEFDTPIYEANNQLSNFNPATQTIVLASSSNRYTINPNNKDFGPRFGAAFSGRQDRAARRLRHQLLALEPRRLQLPDAEPAQRRRRAAGGRSQLPASAATGSNGYLNTEPASRPIWSAPRTTIADASNTALQYMPPNSPDTQVRSWFFERAARPGPQLAGGSCLRGQQRHERGLRQRHQPGQPADSIYRAVGQRCRLRRVFSYPGFGSIIGILPWGYSDYNGLQAKVEKRFSQGLYLLNSFTWSKAIDIAAQALDGGGNCNNCGNGIPSVQNIYDWQADRGISAYNHPFVNTTTVVWSLPVGKGQWLLPNASRVLDAIRGRMADDRYLPGAQRRPARYGL